MVVGRPVIFFLLIGGTLALLAGPAAFVLGPLFMMLEVLFFGVFAMSS